MSVRWKKNRTRSGSESDCAYSNPLNALFARINFSSLFNTTLSQCTPAFNRIRLYGRYKFQLQQIMKKKNKITTGHKYWNLQQKMISTKKRMKKYDSESSFKDKIGLFCSIWWLNSVFVQFSKHSVMNVHQSMAIYESNGKKNDTIFISILNIIPKAIHEWLFRRKWKKLHSWNMDDPFDLMKSIDYERKKMSVHLIAMPGFYVFTFRMHFEKGLWLMRSSAHNSHTQPIPFQWARPIQ